MDFRLVIDIGVLLLYFVVIISIGLRMGRKEDNLEDFALGGRRIPWWAVLASLIAAETSAGTFFGTPGEGFSHRNYTYLQLAFGTIIGAHSRQLHFHQAVLRLQSFLDLRIPDRALWGREQKCGFRGFHDHASARVRRALVCRRHRARPGLRNDQRRAAEPDANALDLRRRHALPSSF